MRALIGVLVAVVACGDIVPRESVRVARIEITPDTAVLLVGDTLAFAAKAYDAADKEIEAEDLLWSTNSELLSVENGLVKALAPHRGSVIARDGSSFDVMAVARVFVQERATHIRTGFSAPAIAVSPGATFLTFPAAWNISDGSPAYVDYGQHEAKAWGVLNSSNPEVADWLRPETNYKGSYNSGWTWTALAPGEAVLRIVSNGVRDSIRIAVRAPQIVFSDSSWNGESWSACGLASDGEAWCRGGNNVGQLGTLTAHWGLCCGSVSGQHQQGSSTWVKVDTDQRFLALATGPSFNCGRAETGAVYCWGANGSGSLGVATSDSLVRTSAGEPRCSYTGVFITYTYYKCHFRPVRVDRDLGHVLHFDEVRTESVRVCGHVIRRGSSDVTAASVDEIWCWGGSYGTPPTQRPGFFQ